MLTAVAVGFTLRWLSSVLIPFVLAIFAAYALDPIVRLLTRRAKLPRPLAVAAALGIGGILFLAGGSVVSTSLAQLSQNAGAYQEKITTLAQQIALQVPFEGFETEVETRLAQLPIGSVLLNLANSLLGVLSNAVLVLIFVVFLLIGESRAAGLTPAVWTEIESRVERYLLAQIVISGVTGILVGVILYLLGVDLALMFGFLAFLLNFIPNVGSIIATLLPLPVLLISPDASLGRALLALVLPGFVQFVIGNIVAPKVMGDALELHPITILLALIFWGVLWGIVGMFLAVPITAVLKILLGQHELTRPVARLMAGRLA